MILEQSNKVALGLNSGVTRELARRLRHRSSESLARFPNDRRRGVRAELAPGATASNAESSAGDDVWKANSIRDMWEILALAAIVIAPIVTNPARGTAIRTSATIFTRPGSGAFRTISPR